MYNRKLPPRPPVKVFRHRSVEVSVWKCVDGYGLRYELTVDRAYEEGEPKSIYSERFRAEHVTDLRSAIEETASWLQAREEQLAELRREIERLAVLRRNAESRLAKDTTSCIAAYRHKQDRREL